MEEKLKLSSPWITFCREVEALFANDSDITTRFSEDGTEIKLYVKGADKAEALEQILPTERTFGSVTVTINVIPDNTPVNKAMLFRKAFAGNKAFTDMITIDGVFTNPISYMVFKKEVVQFYNDDLGDINGNKSTLYQDIAKDIFEDTEGVCFCTDKE